MAAITDNMGFLDKWAYSRILKWAEGRKVEKGRQTIPDYVNEPDPQVRIPQFKEEELLEISKNHWLIRTILRARTEEIINAGWAIESRYRKKCKSCGKEYQNIDVDECNNPGCDSKDFDEPNTDEYKKLQAFLKEPAPNKTMDKFISSTLHYGISLSKYFWEIAQVKTWDTSTMMYTRTPARETRVLNASTILPVANVYGDLGGYEYFCPSCYEAQYLETGRDAFIDIREHIQRRVAIPPCKICGGELESTAYVQNVNGKTVARWTKDELIAEYTWSLEPSVEGLSCIVPAIKHLYIIDYMDAYNLQIYTQGDVGSLVIFPDTDDVEVQELQVKLDNKLKQRLYRDVITGSSERSLQILTAMIGVKSGKEPTRLQLMESLDKLQSFDYYTLYVEKVCGVFGVIPTFTRQSSQGDAGNKLAMTMLVPNSVTKATMINFEEAFNNKLLPKLGINDWVFKFGKVESKDLMRDAQIKQTNMMAVSLAIDKGFDVELTPDAMNYTVSSEPVNETAEDKSSRLAAGKIPQSKDGAPARTMPGGAGDGVAVVEPDKEEE